MSNPLFRTRCQTLNFLSCKRRKQNTSQSALPRPRSKMSNARASYLDKKRLYKYSALSHQIQTYFQEDLYHERERRSTADKRLSLLLKSRLNAQQNLNANDTPMHEMTNKELYNSLLQSITEGKNYRPMPQPSQQDLEKLTYLTQKTEELQGELKESISENLQNRSQLIQSNVDKSQTQNTSQAKYMTNSELFESIFTNAMAESVIQVNEHGKEIAIVDRLAKPETVAQQRCYQAIQDLQFSEKTDKILREKAKKNGQEVYKLLRGQQSMSNYKDDQEIDPWVQKMSNVINQVDQNSRVSKSGSKHSDDFRQIGDEQVALSIRSDQISSQQRHNEILSSGTLRPGDLGLPDESPKKFNPYEQQTTLQQIGLQVKLQQQQFQNLIKQSQTIKNEIQGNNIIDQQEPKQKNGEEKVVLINDLRKIFVDIDSLLTAAQTKLNELQINKLKR